MSRISKYSRKRIGAGIESYNRLSWLDTINQCRPYDPQAPIGGTVATQYAINGAMLKVRESLDSMIKGQVPADDLQIFETLAHAVGVTRVQIEKSRGTDQTKAAILDSLDAGANALNRCLDRRQALGKWGLDGPAIQELKDIVDIYEQIAQASSPAQMVIACRTYAQSPRFTETVTLTKATQ